MTHGHCGCHHNKNKRLRLSYPLVRRNGNGIQAIDFQGLKPCCNTEAHALAQAPYFFSPSSLTNLLTRQIRHV
jgi:hypothetical protein